MYLLGQTEETVESVKRSGRLTLSEGGFHTQNGTHHPRRVLRNLYQIEERYGRRSLDSGRLPEATLFDRSGGR